MILVNYPKFQKVASKSEEEAGFMQPNEIMCYHQ